MTTFGLLIFDGAEELDVVGPWEVFTASAMIQAGAGEGVTNAALTGWIRDTAAKATWVTSVCTGAALLYEAGPARGKHVATHHAYEDALAERGDVTVVRDARYVVDGNLVTSQGVSAGI